MTGNRRPFGAERHHLGDAGVGSSLTLASFPPAQARRMGEALAAIDPWKSYPYPAEGLARYFESVEPGAPRLAIHLGDELVGVVGLRTEWLRGPYLQFLGVLPGRQGLGIGGRILAWMEREAALARNLWVCASDFNLQAIRFYERHGFQRVAVLDGLVQDDRTEVLLRKRISRAQP